MSNVTGLEKERRKKSRRVTLKRLTTVVLVAAAIAVVYSMRFEIVSQGFGVWVNDTLANALDNKGYPVVLDAVPVQLVGVGERVAVLSSGGISLFNSSGNRVAAERVAARTPVAVASGQRLLLYAQGEKELSVRSGSMELFKTTAEQPIYTADLASNGMITYATASTGYRSRLLVLDTRYQPVFEWASADGIVTALSLSPDGKRLACVVVGLKDGSISSKVIGFDVLKGQQVFEYALENELLLSVKIQGNMVAAVSDASAVLLSESGALKSQFDFEDNKLAAFEYRKKGGLCVVLGDYTISHSQNVVLLDAAFKVAATAEVDKKVRAVNEFKDGSMIVFSPDWAIHFDENLTVGRMMETADSSDAVAIGNYVYYTTLKRLDRVAVQ